MKFLKKLVILLILVAIPTAVFLNLPVVRVDCVEGESIFLKKLIRTDLIKAYRVSFKEEKKESIPFITPIKNLKDGNELVYTVGSLSFVPDTDAMWETAFESVEEDQKACILYDSTSLDQIKIAEMAKEGFLKYSYDKNISSVQAKVLSEELKNDGVSLIIAIEPNSSLELLRASGIDVMTTDLYSIALETIPVTFAVGPDYKEMILRAKREGEGGAVPYKVLPCKKGLEVLLDRIF